MFICKTIVTPLLGLNPNYCRHKRIQREEFESEYHKQANKVCAVQHCNIGGEYLFNHFVLDGVVHIFDSDTDYWSIRKDYDIKQESEFVWVMTRNKKADEWLAHIEKMREAYIDDRKRRNYEFTDRLHDIVNMYEFDPELAYFLYGGKESVDRCVEIVQRWDEDGVKTPVRSATPIQKIEK